jgi:hypothetical protein
VKTLYAHDDTPVTTPNRLLGFWRSLSDCNQPKLRYLGRALLADLPVAFAVGLVLNWVTKTSWPEFPAEALPRLFFALCVFAPLVETLGMAIIIWVLRRVMTRTEYVPWVTALICAGLHSLAKPLWGIEIFWSFVIFSLCYTAWEKKSFLQAFWMTAVLHALHNLVPTVALMVARAT